MFRFLQIWILVLFTISSFAQRDQLAIGQWREHIPYDNANSVAIGNGLIYCGSEAGFTTYDPNNFELERFTTINGLSDIGIQMLEFGEYSKTLLVAYKNGNIDLVKGDDITNISFIKNADIIGDKSIYNIRFDKELAYLSCGFGIVVLNVDRHEIKDTYYPDSSSLKVNDVYLHHKENIIFAATENGIYQGNLDQNLSDFNNWSKTPNLPAGNYTLVDYFANYLLFNQTTSVFDSNLIWGILDGIDTARIMIELKMGENNHFQVGEHDLTISKNYNIYRFDENLELIANIYTYDESESQLMRPSETIFKKNKYWIADRKFGLAEFYYPGVYFFRTPNGPNTVSINHMDILNGSIWTTSGILSASYRSSSNLPEFNLYQSLNWTGKDKENDEKLKDLYGFIKIQVNPNDNSQVFSGSWDNGLIEFRNGEVFELYNNQNAEKHSLSPVPGLDLIRIGGLDFDNEGNLWIGNSETPYALSKLQPSTMTWESYYLGNIVDEYSIVGDVLVTQNNHKWILLNRHNKIIVFDENRPTNDRTRVLTATEGSGNIPGGTIHCLAEDESGSIWIGTDEGPAVFYNPSSVFESNIEAQRIFVQQDGQTQVLLETENIRTIAIDGANRKWFGSTNSGAYLMSSDGTQEINHFTVQNSPLFSDDIKHINIDQMNGEVYFCTSDGLISYRGTATMGGEDFGDVQVYPNPVPQGYSGLIAINGLAQNSNVKITDVNGILVYETASNGGQAIWDGRSLTGNKAKNGVYLIFSTNTSGESQNVSKILFLNN